MLNDDDEPVFRKDGSEAADSTGLTSGAGEGSNGLATGGAAATAAWGAGGGGTTGAGDGG